MGMEKAFNTLGQTVLPKIAKSVFPDKMNLLRETAPVSDGGGGVIKGNSSNVTTTAIPCSYEPITGFKTLGGEALTSTVQYNVIFATTHEGVAVGVKSTDRIRVLARGNQTEKLFRIVGLKNNSGVYYEAVCQLEDAV